MKRFSLPLLLVITAVAGRAQYEVDFDATGHLDLNFETAAASNLWSESATGGLGNSGAVAMPAIADNQLWTLGSSYAGNTDHSISLYIRTTDVLNAGYIAIGITANTPQAGIVFPSGADYLGVSVNPDSGEFEVHGEGAFNHSGGTFETAMQANSWYHLELTYDWQFDETYGMQFRVRESDANGNLGVDLINGGTFFAGLTSGIANDASAHAFMGGNNTGNILDYVDNFATTGITGAPLSAVPEPSTYAALLGACALGLAAWRRRQQPRA
ncbi:PEP-CTERM sorting domain-containing protein [Actomonas aquatica]|uniref:PEP-CTERM sorting domain-containing protein n=1 Tax=Actomonas aquatica TaxID=2866162 RepID=A0ABZ1C2Q9_9BACT|nr:PEP-CTERM sorting domain-containing protein [Opitutus sp. WL0086]WRQ85979.1 PEP-CTERM sorting domain-containing protein [Opitutus sp. WL0086]